MDTYYPLPTLYGKPKTGSMKQWTIRAEHDEDDTAWLVTEHGRVGGQLQVDRKQVKGKNKGRSNETNAFEQAKREARSLWKKKLDQNYRQSQQELDNLPLLPMLAHKFTDHKHKIKWPAIAQPKFNGVRCLVTKQQDGTITFTSRKGKHYETLDYMEYFFTGILMEGEVLDGEIYHHDLTFQQIIERVKRVLTDRQELEHVKLQYHIFDYVNDAIYEKRYQVLKNRYDTLLAYVPTANTFVKLAESVGVNSEDEFLARHKEFVAQGYEGTMLRTLTGRYVPDYRSYDLLKYKDFIDEEFEIVGVAQGSGREEGAIIYICQTRNGQEFSVRPKGSIDTRKELYQQESDKFIGKYLTVRFQNLSDDGVPIFPVGVVIRDGYE